MERWLWFVLFGVVAYFAYDYGHRVASEAPLSAELSVYRERDKLRAELARERLERSSIISAAMAGLGASRDRERAEAAASTLAGCPVDPVLDGLRRERDAEANAAIDAAYRDRERADRVRSD